LNDLTVKGITAYKTGNRIEARQLLRLATVQDPNDIIAWIWLSAAVDSIEDRRSCLETVLKIDPTNVLAQRGLEKLQKAQNPVPFEPEEEPDTSEVAPGSPFLPDPGQEPIPPEVSPEALDASEKKKRPVKHKTVWIVVGSLGLVFICAVGAYIWAQQYINRLLTQAMTPQPTEVAIQSTPITPTEGTPSSGVDWTPTLTRAATMTLSPTPSPTKTPTVTPTFRPAGPTVDAAMLTVQNQVADVRGVAITTGVDSNLITIDQAQAMLSANLSNAQVLAELDRRQHAWSALGLIPSSYDLFNTALNNVIEGTGGFYRPQTKQLFVFGIRFHVRESYIYAHEYDHALIDSTYNLENLGYGSNCLLSEQTCDAARALVEGDATLAMQKWLESYTNKDDYSSLIQWKPELQAIPDKSAPAFIQQNAGFTNQYGYEFVKTLFDRGGWNEVNQAYANPPTTSAQILHPDIYLARTQPVAVDDPNLGDLLGSNWQNVASGSLGEWTTSLILAYGTETGARIDPAMAQKAAAGWGGDHYQIYFNPDSGAASGADVVAVHWVWDSLADSAEFDQAARQYLSGRYQSQGTAGASGSYCWQANNQTSCLFQKEEQTLWIIAPDQSTIDQIRALYLLFR
jgi:hypothetical protein